MAESTRNEPYFTSERRKRPRGSIGRASGRTLLKDALLRITKASEQVVARAVIVHAVDQEAVPFYARYGFREFPIGNQTLF